jgi:hypothetical protein
MTTPRQPASSRTSARPAPRKQDPKDLQPQATGANRGSPAAPVMKQFAKTKAESSGKS